MKDPLQYPQDEGCVQHPLCLSQILYMEDVSRKRLFEPCQQSQSVCRSAHMFACTMREGDIIMTLLESLLASHEYLITS